MLRTELTEYIKHIAALGELNGEGKTIVSQLPHKKQLSD
jgi:hypothetical protein